jgi:O-antigen/teichoic acid export membrane protein
MDPLTIWIWSLVGGGVVLVIVAALLLAILATARRIDRHAQEIWNVGKNIAGSTVSIWMLNRTNQIAREILTTAQSIDATIASLADKLAQGRAP